MASSIGPEAPEKSIAHFVEQAQVAERGLFDLLFLADSSAPWGPVDLEFQSRTMQATNFEPVGLLSALSMVTKHVGLVATSTTSFDEPYLVARKFGSLDQLSGGRAGWNLVTSTNEREAFNFGKTKFPSHEDRYDRASEFADVVIGLWDSWDDDAFIRNRETGYFFDPTKMHALNHVGKHFSVRGPLSVGRSPQGRPVVVQAGSSESGRELASRTARHRVHGQPEHGARPRLCEGCEAARGKVRTLAGFGPHHARSRADRRPPRARMRRRSSMSSTR